MNNYHVTPWMRLIPESRAKALPSYIPASIREDYEEACKVETASPKASATLSRRCLQGIIREFYGIRKRQLVEEIAALKEVLSTATWDAMDGLRSIGNIGAHPEADVNTIIEIEPEEAAELIGLVEVLIEQTFIARHDEEERLARVKAIAKDKKDERKAAEAPTPSTTP